MGVQSTQMLVLGGGPAGYAAAFRAADMGMKVTLVDSAPNPGGVCLYRGCIPSKALLHVTKLIEESRHSSEWGVTFKEPKIDLIQMREYKNKVVKKLTSGLGGLSKARNINFVQGHGKFANDTSIIVETSQGIETISFEKCVIATGSRPLVLPHLSLDSDLVMDSTDALELPEIPKDMLLIGGGVISMEIGMVYSVLGSKVSVVEMLPDILAGFDRDVAKPLLRKVDKEFEEIMVNTKVTGLKEVNGEIEVTFDTPDLKGVKKTYRRVLVAIGRKPNSDNIGIENTSIAMAERGFIAVNKKQETNVPGIYAVGDVIGNPMLAHKGSHEAHVAVENANGGKSEFAPYTIPGVVYTEPEIASAGITETEAKANGLNYKAVTFPWAASGRATAVGANDGLTKLIFDRETDRIIGMGIVGSGAGDLISEGALAIEMGALASDLAHTIHPHPTLSETIMEAAELYLGHCDHLPPSKK